MAFWKVFSVLGMAACLSAADQGLLNLASPDTRIVAGINVQQAKTSRFGQYLIANAMKQQDQGFRQFVAQTGFDPTTDLTEVLFFAPGGKANAGRKLIAARGAFNADALEAAAKAHGAQITDYHGKSLVKAPETAHPESFAILDSSTAVAGDPASVEQAIDRSGGSGLSPSLAAQINTVSGQYDAWFVSLVPVSDLARQVPDQRVNGALNGGALNGISQIVGGVKLVPEGANFSADIQSDTAQNATSLAGALQFLGGLAMMSSQQPPPALTAAMNSLKVAANGNTVTVNFSIPESVLETAHMRRAPQRRAAPGVRSRAR